jgi:hypothetical protein
MRNRTKDVAGRVGTVGTRFGKDTTDGSAAYYGSPDKRVKESRDTATVGLSSEGARRRREGAEDGPPCEARPLAPSTTDNSDQSVKDAEFDCEVSADTVCPACGSPGGPGFCANCDQSPKECS